ncbi:MAG: hydrogenase formation protein HypD [Bacteroidia bacterium]|nr:hydrogenase formation protein HypD [Bacteroidia bacterium]
MKYLKEYRDADSVKKVLDQIHQVTTDNWSIMEVCGGQTHSLVKNGILDLLPGKIRMVHGPGCPVCVTPVRLIDKAIYLAEKEDVILCSFGDMLRVPGSNGSLLEAKARGGDIRILYSPLEAVNLAKDNPEKEVVFFAVGFETTAPANALSVIHARKLGLKNYSILASHVLVPPAIEAIMNDELSQIDGFLAAGHVCTVMGYHEYFPLAEKYNIPLVVTGFEPLDLVQGILMTVQLLETGKSIVENQYTRMVTKEGNEKAQEVIRTVFEISDRSWRGIGVIPQSGFEVRSEYSDYDAKKKFRIDIQDAPENPLCISGDVMKGIKRPVECPAFGKECTPQNPLGAPMVSSEGACAAYYHYADIQQ